MSDPLWSPMMREMWIIPSSSMACQKTLRQYSIYDSLSFMMYKLLISALGDYNRHVGLGVKCSKEVATAIRGAIILAKLSVVPVRRGYWGNKIGKPHTVPCKVSGKCGSVLVRLIPAPRGTGIVSAPVPKKL